MNYNSDDQQRGDRGELIVCPWCDHAIAHDGYPIRLIPPKAQCKLDLTHRVCSECKKRLEWENALYGGREITLSPSVARRINP